MEFVLYLFVLWDCLHFVGSWFYCQNLLLLQINFRKSYYPCPDDKAFRYMASLYSESHHNMSLSKEFPGGITNGAFWYVTKSCIKVVLFILHHIFQWSTFVLHILFPNDTKHALSTLAGTPYMVECKIGIIFMVAVLNWHWKLVMTNGLMQVR